MGEEKGLKGAGKSRAPDRARGQSLLKLDLQQKSLTLSLVCILKISVSVSSGAGMS